MNVVDLIVSKALFFKEDESLAVVLSLEGENIVIDMENFGVASLPIEAVQNGFIALMDNKSLVKTFILREIPFGITFDEEQIWRITERVAEIMQDKFTDLKFEEVHQAIKELYS